MSNKSEEYCEIWTRPIDVKLRQPAVHWAQFVAVSRRDGRWHEITRSMPIQLAATELTEKKFAPSRDIISHTNAHNALVRELTREGWQETNEENIKWWQKHFVRRKLEGQLILG